MTQVKSFEVTDAELVGHAAGGVSRRVAWSDFVAILEARIELVFTDVDDVRRPNDRVAPAGIEASLRGHPSSGRTDARTADEQVLVVFLRTSDAPLLFRATGLNYSGLGTRMAFTAQANFREMLGEFRRRAPDALFDSRFAKRWKYAAAGDSSAPKAHRETSNILQLAHVLVMAARDGQL